MSDDNYGLVKIPDSLLIKWQGITNLLADFLSVPSVLIMRTDEEFMEVLISSKSENNPYHAGDKEHWCGLYCETVIKTQKKLLVPNATIDKNWNQNPDIKLGMIAYLGFPINYPNQKPFGTICVLDNHENHFSEQYEKLLVQFKSVIESDIAFFHSYNNELIDYAEQQVKLINKNQELQLAQERLQQSEEKFRSLYNNMSEGSAMHTLVYNEEGVPVDYRIVEVNPAFEAQLEIQRETVINKTSREAYGVDQPPYFELYTKVAITGKPEVFETYFPPLDKYFLISVYCPGKDSFATVFKNITKRKKAEKERAETQKLLEESQQIGKIGGWELNIDTLQLKWTKEMYAIHELDATFKPEVEKRGDFYTPESLLIVDKAVRNAIERGESYDLDLEITTAKGNHRSIRSIGKADLENRRVIGFFQDVTEKKQIEQKLVKSEKELKKAQEMTHIGNFYIDLLTSEVTWTEELYKMYGFDPTLPPPLLNESQTLFTPESWNLLSSSIAKTAQTGKPYQIELINLRKDGKRGWMWAKGEANRNAEGKITSVWGTVQDITERKLVEEALKRSEEKYRNLVDNSLVGVFTSKLNGQILYANNALAKLLDEESVEDVISKNAMARYKHPEQREHILSLLKQNGKVEGEELTLITANGNEKVIWQSIVLDSDTISGIVVDVTYRHLLMNEIKHKNSELAELNATKDKFFSIIAHDLKGPFSAILGFTELLVENQQTLSNEEKDTYLKNIYTTTKTTYQLLENLLNWARSQSGNIRLAPEAIQLRSLVNDVVDILEQAVKNKKINISNAVNPELTIYSDKNTLHTIIRNLISNAIKYTSTNGTITVKAQLKNNFVEVSISDTGVGMDEQTVQSLFNLTETISKTGTANEKGTGLGLVLCKEFVEKQKGKIWVESELGVGSTFYFNLPL